MANLEGLSSMCAQLNEALIPTHAFPTAPEQEQERWCSQRRRLSAVAPGALSGKGRAADLSVESLRSRAGRPAGPLPGTSWLGLGGCHWLPRVVTRQVKGFDGVKDGFPLAFDSGLSTDRDL